MNNRALFWTPPALEQGDDGTYLASYAYRSEAESKEPMRDPVGSLTEGDAGWHLMDGITELGVQPLNRWDGMAKLEEMYLAGELTAKPLDPRRWRWMAEVFTTEGTDMRIGEAAFRADAHAAAQTWIDGVGFPITLQRVTVMDTLLGPSKI